MTGNKAVCFTLKPQCRAGSRSLDSYSHFCLHHFDVCFAVSKRCLHSISARQELLGKNFAPLIDASRSIMPNTAAPLSRNKSIAFPSKQGRFVRNRVIRTHTLH